MISDERAQQAFRYLEANTDRIGDARGELERSEILRKRVRKKVFMASEGTVAVREAFAETSTEVHEADDRYVAAIIAYETLKAKKDLESLAMDVWRTEEASRRKTSSW